MTYLVLVLLLSTMMGSGASPHWPAEYWQKADMNAQGLNPDLVGKYVSYLKDDSDFNPESILIVENGFMVKEYYASDSIKYQSHHMYEISKSIISVATGAAIQSGIIDSVDQKILQLLPEMGLSNIDTRKTDITVKHLLTMTSGYIDQVNRYEEDWVAELINSDLVADPGSTFIFGCQAINLLPVIIETQTSQSFVEFIQANLFDHLNIDQDSVTWAETSGDLCDADNAYAMLPQDLAKIGLLMIKDGMWDGTRLLPQGWSTEASTKYVEGTYKCHEDDRGFGYTWWLSSNDADANYYYAEGKFGQKVYVLPEHDLVVVLHGAAVTNIYDITRQQNYAFNTYLIPALDDDASRVNMAGLVFVISTLLVAVIPLRRRRENK